jgi:thiol-disulfide isomerase/thioredoxin
MQKQMRRFSTVVLLLSFLVPGRVKAQELVGKLSWHDTRGNLQTISDYKGKIVVLNFWATWCVPCQHEMPMLVEIQRKYANKSVVVLGGSLDDRSTQSKIQPFAEKDSISFPLLVGVTTEQMKQLQLGEAIPATAFFDAQGSLVGRVLGELNKSALEHRIDWMLGKHHGKEPPAFVNGLHKKADSACGPPVFAH